MAPEVAKREPYNEKCDVFSFAILFYEIVVLKKPYNLKYKSRDKLHNMIALKGHRPSIPIRSCSSRIEKLLKTSWMKAPVDRPSMKIINDEISNELEGLDNDIETRNKLLQDRSTRSANSSLDKSSEKKGYDGGVK